MHCVFFFFDTLNFYLAGYKIIATVYNNKHLSKVQVFVTDMIICPQTCFYGSSLAIQQQEISMNIAVLKQTNNKKKTELNPANLLWYCEVLPIPVVVKLIYLKLK